MVGREVDYWRDRHGRENMIMIMIGHRRLRRVYWRRLELERGVVWSCLKRVRRDGVEVLGEEL